MADIKQITMLLKGRVLGFLLMMSCGSLHFIPECLSYPGYSVWASFLLLQTLGSNRWWLQSREPDTTWETWTELTSSACHLSTSQAIQGQAIQGVN